MVLDAPTTALCSANRFIANETRDLNILRRMFAPIDAIYMSGFKPRRISGGGGIE